MPLSELMWWSSSTQICGLLLQCYSSYILHHYQQSPWNKFPGLHTKSSFIRLNKDEACVSTYFVYEPHQLISLRSRGACGLESLRLTRRVFGLNGNGARCEIHRTFAIRQGLAVRRRIGCTPRKINAIE